MLFVVLLSGDVRIVRGGSSALDAPLSVCLSVLDVYDRRSGVGKPVFRLAPVG